MKNKRGPGVAVRAAVFAAPVRVYARVEADVRARVVDDGRFGGVAQKLRFQFWSIVIQRAVVVWVRRVAQPLEAVVELHRGAAAVDGFFIRV